MNRFEGKRCVVTGGGSGIGRAIAQRFAQEGVRRGLGDASCLLTFGHYGWSKDLPHQQRLRDVMGLEIGDGAAGLVKLIIARDRIGRAAA